MSWRRILRGADGSSVLADRDGEVSSLVEDRTEAARPLTPEEKAREQHRAGLVRPDAVDHGLSWADAVAKQARLEGRVSEARAGVAAAETAVADLRAARVRAELAEEPGPEGSALKAAEGRLTAARALLEDREAAVKAFRPTALGAKRRALAAQESELDEAIATDQARIHAIEAEVQALQKTCTDASFALQGALDRRAAVRREGAELDREIAALGRRP